MKRLLSTVCFLSACTILNAAPARTKQTRVSALRKKIINAWVRLRKAAGTTTHLAVRD